MLVKDSPERKYWHSCELIKCHDILQNIIARLRNGIWSSKMCLNKTSVSSKAVIKTHIKRCNRQLACWWAGPIPTGRYEAHWSHKFVTCTLIALEDPLAYITKPCARIPWPWSSQGYLAFRNHSGSLFNWPSDDPFQNRFHLFFHTFEVIIY